MPVYEVDVIAIRCVEIEADDREQAEQLAKRKAPPEWDPSSATARAVQRKDGDWIDLG